MNWRDFISTMTDGIKISIKADITITPEKRKNNFKATCDDCGWSYGYASTFSAKRGLENHRENCEAVKLNRHKVEPDEFTWIHREDSEVYNDDV